jgi:hypothetical protein
MRCDGGGSRTLTPAQGVSELDCNAATATQPAAEQQPHPPHTQPPQWAMRSQLGPGRVPRQIPANCITSIIMSIIMSIIIIMGIIVVAIVTTPVREPPGKAVISRLPSSGSQPQPSTRQHSHMKSPGAHWSWSAPKQWLKFPYVSTHGIVGSDHDPRTMPA